MLGYILSSAFSVCSPRACHGAREGVSALPFSALPALLGTVSCSPLSHLVIWKRKRKEILMIIVCLCISTQNKCCTVQCLTTRCPVPIWSLSSCLSFSKLPTALWRSAWHHVVWNKPFSNPGQLSWLTPSCLWCNITQKQLRTDVLLTLFSSQCQKIASYQAPRRKFSYVSAAVTFYHNHTKDNNSKCWILLLGTDNPGCKYRFVCM